MQSDADLLRAAGRGESAAWSELVNRHSQLVFANSRAVGADHTLAQDVVQLVWIRVLNRLETIRDPDRLRGWLAIVARNTTRSELRKLKPTTDLDDLFTVADDASPVERRLERHEQTGMVGAALSAISERCRELLTLMFGAEMSYEEICEATGMAIGSIGPTRQRCLNALRQQLPAGVSDG